MKIPSLVKYILATAFIVLVLTSCVYGVIIVLHDMTGKPETIELTIEHLWEEDNKYYFADSDGNVYKLSNYRDVSDKIMYNEMPKHRFERLNEGSRYEVEYISGLDNWISISEKEI